MDHSRLRDASKVVHAGQAPDPSTGAVMPSISVSTTYVQESPGVHKGYEYARPHNPTRYALERMIAGLENTGISLGDDVTGGGFAFVSGLASIATMLDFVPHGGRVVAMDDLYGGTGRLIRMVRTPSQGIDAHFVDLTSDGAIKDALTPDTKLVWVETPTNPLLKVVDLAKIAVIAKAQAPDAILCCDSTFATPMLQRPLELGFDVVMHSSTKYLNGHSDAVGGLLATNRQDLAERIRYHQNAVGASMSPFDAYLTLRGIKTLHVRMQRHCQSAVEIATFLENHPKIERTVYPGLSSHPQHEIAAKQMDGFSGIITIYMNGGLDESRRFLERVKIFALAESLGGVESLIEHPAIMTHASVPPEMRTQLGISDSLIRLSVGVEDTQDLIDDLSQALG